MHPNIHLNGAAIGVTVIVGFLFGWLWYGPLFGKKWATLMNLKMDECQMTFKKMAPSMILGLIGNFLTTYVMAHSSEVWHPSSWGVGADGPAYIFGFFNGFFTWLGFYVPMLLSGVAWEGKSWALFRLNAAYAFIHLQIIGMILAYWR